MSAETRSWLARYWPILTVLAVGCSVSGWSAAIVHRDGRKSDDQRFELETRQVAAVFEMNMARYEERLARFADHCAQFDELPTDVWHFRHGFVTDLNGNLPAVLHAVYSPKIAAADFAAHLERGQAVWNERYLFDATAAPDRDLALPVWHHWGRSGLVPIPRGSDTAVAGAMFPSLRPALGASNAWSDTQPATARRTDGTLVNGFWFGFPLFAADQAQPRSVRDPRYDLAEQTRRGRELRSSVAKGVLAVFLSTDHLVDRAFNSADRPARVHVRLYSEREPRPGALLNPVSPSPPNPSHRRILVKPWYGQRWCIEFLSTPLFDAESASRDAWPIGFGGMSFTLLAAALIGVGIRAKSRQERLTAEVTEARNTLAAAERERENLGYNLHDGAIQSLYAIQLGLTRTARDVAEAVPAASRVLDESRQRVDHVIAELRRFIHSSSTRWSSDGTPALEHVLASIVQSLQATSPARLTLQAPAGTSDRLSTSEAAALALLARSALGNALRHSDATHIRVALAADANGVTLVIEDNGKGFVVSEHDGDGLGLPSMRKRAATAGAELTIHSLPGRGTRVEVHVPHRPGCGDSRVNQGPATSNPPSA